MSKSKYIWLPSWERTPRYAVENPALEIRVWPFGVHVQIWRWAGTVRLAVRR
jgi:hypothetical protein